MSTCIEQAQGAREISIMLIRSDDCTYAVAVTVCRRLRYRFSVPNVTNAETPEDVLRAVGGEGTVRASRWRGQQGPGWLARGPQGGPAGTGFTCHHCRGDVPPMKEQHPNILQRSEKDVATC